MSQAHATFKPTPSGPSFPPALHASSRSATAPVFFSWAPLSSSTQRSLVVPPIAFFLLPQEALAVKRSNGIVTLNSSSPPSSPTAFYNFLSFQSPFIVPRGPLSSVWLIAAPPFFFPPPLSVPAISQSLSRLAVFCG